MNIKLRPRKVTQFLLIISGGLTLAHIAEQLSEIYLGRTFGLFLFEMDREPSIPRFYSAVALLLCSGLLLIIALANKERHSHNFLYWMGLAIVFIFLAITKDTSLHEDLAVAIRSVFRVPKFQFYAWAYGIVVIIFLGVYLKFLLSLPRKTVLLFVISGCIFIAGAFGMDLVVASPGKLLDHRTALYIILSTLEEVLEMGGIIGFVYTLLSYMSSELRSIGVGIVE